MMKGTQDLTKTENKYCGELIRKLLIHNEQVSVELSNK